MPFVYKSGLSIPKISFDNFPLLQESIKNILTSLKNKEKRKRSFFDFAFNRFVLQSTPIDYFSRDIIQILVTAKKIAQITKEKEINLDLIFLSLCINSEAGIYSLLQNYGISKKKIIRQYLTSEKHTKLSAYYTNYFFKKILSLVSTSFLLTSIRKVISLIFYIPIKILKGLLSFLKPTSNLSRFLFKLFVFNRPLSEIKLSQECSIFFKALMLLAEKKYKTPVICTELLALAFLQSKYKELLKPLFYSNKKFYEFKFCLSKKLYDEELYLKENVARNQHKFSYALKSASLGSFFRKLVTKEELLETGDLEIKTASVRKFLIKNLKMYKAFKALEKEILQCVFIGSVERTYRHI